MILEAMKQAIEAVELGAEWTPCIKLPVVVHVRKQRQNESFVSTREGITTVNPDDLIMRGVTGEEYPISREIFNQTYTTTIDATQTAATQAAPAEWIALVKEARRLAMEQTCKAKIPECGNFGAIAQDLDYLIGLMTSPPAAHVQKISTSEKHAQKTEVFMHVQPPRPWPRQSCKK
jgi:hypothetical protein